MSIYLKKKQHEINKKSTTTTTTKKKMPFKHIKEQMLKIKDLQNPINPCKNFSKVVLMVLNFNTDSLTSMCVVLRACEIVFCSINIEIES